MAIGAVCAALAAAGCNPPGSQRPGFALAEVPPDPCAGAVSSAVNRPFDEAVAPKVREAIDGATWVAYAELTDVQPDGRGGTVVAVRPLELLKGPCRPTRIVATSPLPDWLFPPGYWSVVLIDGGRPPEIIGELDELRVPELEEAYGVKLVQADTAVVSDQRLPDPTAAP